MPAPVGATRAPSWVLSVLQKIGAPVTPVNVQALQLWAIEEGAPAGSNNWLNTTLPGYGGSPRPGLHGSCVNYPYCIYNYPSESAGTSAIADTILQKPSIVKAFRDPNGSLAGIYAGIQGSTWCSTKGCAQTNPGYPQTFQMGNVRVATGSTLATQLAAASSVAGQTGTQGPSGCGAKVGSNPGEPNQIFTLPHTSVGITWCNLKAILGGLEIAVGGVVALFGVGIIVAAGLKRENPLALAAGRTGSALAGRRAARTDVETAQIRHTRELEASSSPGRSGSASSRITTRSTAGARPLPAGEARRDSEARGRRAAELERRRRASGEPADEAF